MFSGDIERDQAWNGLSAKLERCSFSKTAFNENYLKKETIKNRNEQ